MDEYISRRELLARYDAEHEGTPGRARELIKQAPAADVAPVRHGRWKNGGNGLYDTCSACGKEIYLAIPMNYCPNCGARIDKEADHD